MNSRILLLTLCAAVLGAASCPAQGDAPGNAPPTAEEKARATEDKARSARERKAAAHAFKWEKSYKRAQAVAKETGLPIAVLFTGTSWCGFCMKLEDNVLSKPEFKEAMKGGAVGYKVVLPAPGQYLNKKDAKLASQLGARGGVPCLMVVSPEGKILGTLVGYPPTATPASYAARIKVCAGK